MFFFSKHDASIEEFLEFSNPKQKKLHQTLLHAFISCCNTSLCQLSASYFSLVFQEKHYKVGYFQENDHFRPKSVFQNWKIISPSSVNWFQQFLVHWKAEIFSFIFLFVVSLCYNELLCYSLGKLTEIHHDPLLHRCLSWTAFIFEPSFDIKKTLATLKIEVISSGWSVQELRTSENQWYNHL